MRIRLISDVSGSRNGVPWPARGSLVELPDDEAARMCQNGMAEPVDSSTDRVENAMAADDSSHRGLTTMTAGATVPHQQDASGALIPVTDNTGGTQDSEDDGSTGDTGQPPTGGPGDGTQDTTGRNDGGDTGDGAKPARKPAAAKKTAAKPPAAGQ